jgi:CRP-like cAMP-binding protein
MVSESSYDLLGRAPLFAGLPYESAASVAAAASVRQAGAGTILFHQGDPPNYLLLMADGLARLTQLSPDGVQTTLRITGVGAMIGCVAAFQQFPYPVTATAIAECTILSWRAPQFRDLMRQYPVLAENALRIVGTHARDMVARVVEMSGKRIEQRVAGALLRLAGEVGIEVETGIQLAFPVTRDDLAGMAGVTYFTISRVLSRWQRGGLVKNGRQRLTILAPAHLGRLAAGAGA